jgi:hypothetical protein
MLLLLEILDLGLFSSTAKESEFQEFPLPDYLNPTVLGTANCSNISYVVL